MTEQMQADSWVMAPNAWFTELILNGSTSSVTWQRKRRRIIENEIEEKASMTEIKKWNVTVTENVIDWLNPQCVRTINNETENEGINHLSLPLAKWMLKGSIYQRQKKRRRHESRIQLQFSEQILKSSVCLMTEKRINAQDMKHESCLRLQFIPMHHIGIL